MYLAVVQPTPPKASLWCTGFKLGCPPAAVVNPDALASLLTGSPAVALPSGSSVGAGLGDLIRVSRARQLRMFRPPLTARRGLGCADGCQCGGKCKGVGDAQPASSPGFFDQLTNPLGSDLTILKQQLDTLNQQTASVSDAMSTSNLGTFVLVGLAGLGLWMAVKGARGGLRAVGERREKKKKKAAKRARLKAELAAL